MSDKDEDEMMAVQSICEPRWGPRSRKNDRDPGTAHDLRVKGPAVLENSAGKNHRRGPNPLR